MTLIDSALADTINISEQATALSINNCAVAPTASQINLALNLVSNFAGGTVADSRFVRLSLASAGSYVTQTNFVTGVTFSGNVHISLTNRANATTGAWTATQAVDCTWANETVCGGRRRPRPNPYATPLQPAEPDAMAARRARIRVQTLVIAEAL